MTHSLQFFILACVGVGVGILIIHAAYYAVIILAVLMGAV